MGKGRGPRVVQGREEILLWVQGTPLLGWGSRGTSSVPLQVDRGRSRALTWLLLLVLLVIEPVTDLSFTPS